MSRTKTTPYEQIITFATVEPVPDVEKLLVTVRTILKARGGQTEKPRKQRKAKGQPSLMLEGAE